VVVLLGYRTPQNTKILFLVSMLPVTVISPGQYHSTVMATKMDVQYRDHSTVTVTGRLQSRILYWIHHLCPSPYYGTVHLCGHDRAMVLSWAKNGCTLMDIGLVRFKLRRLDSEVLDTSCRR
jgi:hypothetical protein